MSNIKSFPNNQDEYVGAEWVMRWLHGRTSGVWGAANNAAVSPGSGMSVNVSDGLGWLANSAGDGIVWWNDTEEDTGTPLNLTIAMANASLPRIDRVVVTWETTDYVALPTITVLTGTPASSPTPPALTNSNLQRQISLAKISVPAGTTAITAAMITDERLDSTVCGLVTENVSVDTSVIQAQLTALLEEIEEELQSIIGQAVPDHASTHETGGDDPIVVDSDMIENGAVGPDKIAAGAVGAVKLGNDIKPANVGIKHGTATPTTTTCPSGCIYLKHS